MIFNSYVFWLFFGLVAIGCHLLRNRWTLRNRLLLISSYVFYGYWDWRFLFLMLFSTCVDHAVALKIASGDSPKAKKRFLLVSLVANLSLLGVFKYYGFFATELAEVLSAAGIAVHMPFLNLILPVGISFYTFQTLSYTIDVYRGVTQPTRDIWNFALYVSFFPQLVAGPIERSSHLLPQFEKQTALPDNFRIGLYHVLFGLFKKIVIADNLAIIADAAFSTDGGVDRNSLEILVGVYAFAFQIYCDFSGYSSIAIGVSRWLGFDLCDNFRQPYFAASPQEFWHRWHISLSSWLRDYLYIPLGGSRGGSVKTYRNLLLTMVLGGLWHGANWTFIIWGILHGGLLAAHRLIFYKKKVARDSGVSERSDSSTPARRVTGVSSSNTVSLPGGGVDHGAGRPEPRGSWKALQKLGGIFFTFHAVCLGWLFFRAASFEHACAMIRGFCDMSWGMTAMASYSIGILLFLVGPLLCFELWVERRKKLLALLDVHWIWRGMVYFYFVVMILFFYAKRPSGFIYFQF